MYYGKEAGKKYWIKRAIFFPVIIAAGIFIFGNIVMYLWNAILPEVLGLNIITFWQALGILLLAKILFGGFHGGKHHGRCGYKMRDKWMHLSEEDKEKLRKEWQNRDEAKDAPE